MTPLKISVELYQLPTLLLLAAVVAVFAGLWVRGTSLAVHEQVSGVRPGARRRQLLWLAGWVFLVARLGMQLAGWNSPSWLLSLSLSAMLLAPLMFLASMAPQFMFKKPRVPFVAAFGVPLIVYGSEFGRHPVPGPMGHLLLLGCAVGGIAVTVQWSLDEDLLPTWISLSAVVLVGGAAGWLTMRQQYGEVIALTHSGILLMTALLFVSAFRRVTPGLVFTVGGLTLWALPELLRPMLHMGHVPIGLERAVNLTKVIAAVGMIVLVLEEEIASNVGARERDRRTRAEMERYTALYVADHLFNEETTAWDEVCEAIASASRFSQAAIFMQSPEGGFLLAGRAGIGTSLEVALDAMARRTTALRAERLAKGSHFTEVAGSLALMDLAPLLEPGDDLERMNFRSAYFMAIRGREQTMHGAVMLAGLREPGTPLTIEDVLPLELLISRIGAARDHAGLLRRVVQSERLAGLGQLAGGVAHELNNPLQAVSGFAELLVESADVKTRRHAEVILAEARRMKQIIGGLLQFRGAPADARVPVSVAELLADAERLMRSELAAEGIVARLRAPEELPRVLADAEQMRQVFAQVIRNAMGALRSVPADEEKRLSIEVERLPRAVHFSISHNGQPFVEPGRPFDPFFRARTGRNGSSGAVETEHGIGRGLGLSICYAIVREHGGGISAVNLSPKGAAVVIELPVYAEENGEANGQAARRHETIADPGHAPAR